MLLWKLSLDGPAGHRALLDAVFEPARLRLLEQRDEDLLEKQEVLIHRQLLVAADEPADGLEPEQGGGVESRAA